MSTYTHFPEAVKSSCLIQCSGESRKILEIEFLHKIIPKGLMLQNARNIWGLGGFKNLLPRHKTDSFPIEHGGAESLGFS